MAEVGLVAAYKNAESSLGVQLLTDLREVFGGADEVSSKAILYALNALEESPWGDLRGKPMDERALASHLKEYGVKSRSVRGGVSPPKGYRRAELFEVWDRYLPALAEKSATSATCATTQNDRKKMWRMLRMLRSSHQRRATRPADVATR